MCHQRTLLINVKGQHNENSGNREVDPACPVWFVNKFGSLLG